MKRRGFLKAVGLLAVAGCLPERTGGDVGAKKTAPNVVFILVDDLGWVDVGCYGSKYYETPNIDRLSREGMRFTDGYAACAVCSPTRAAVMTGRYPARTGITDWIHDQNFKGDRSDPNQKGPDKWVGGKSKKVLCPPNPYWMELEEITIAEILKEQGYTTCHVGKWHLGPKAWYPEAQGFDYNFGGCAYGQPPSYFDPYGRGASRPNIPTLSPRKKGEYLTDREADEAVGFIKKHKDEPFFLYMAHYAVHTPIQGKKELVEKYEAKDKAGQKNATYAAMVESVDDAVGRLLDTLEELGLEENTVVFFTGDNGGLLRYTNNAPLRMGKGYPYEGGIREPVIVRWPGHVKPASVSDTPVTSVDYLPTICEMAGAKLPAGRVIDGESLTGVLKGKAKLKRDAIYWHFPHYRRKIVPYSIVRAGDWKLIKRYEGKKFELFNLKDDISEENDLAAKMPGKVKQLDAMLVNYLKESNAKIPVPNPDYSARV